MGAALQSLSPNRRSMFGFAARALRGLAGNKSGQYLNWTLDMMGQSDKDDVWRRDFVRPTEEWIDGVLPQGLSSLDTLLSGDVRIILLSDLLVKMDMATMAASIEARSPLMDHELAEFAATLPDSFRIHGGVTKAVLRDAYANVLPEEILRAPKRGFEPPVAKWLKEDLKPLLTDTLGSASSELRAYVSGIFLDKLLNRSVLPSANTPILLYSLLVLELWLRNFRSKAKTSDQI
jgi:asparagine synthase (glutamine-hydrolysing)